MKKQLDLETKRHIDAQILSIEGFSTSNLASLELETKRVKKDLNRTYKQLESLDHADPQKFSVDVKKSLRTQYQDRVRKLLSKLNVLALGPTDTKRALKIEVIEPTTLN